MVSFTTVNLEHQLWSFQAWKTLENLKFSVVTEHVLQNGIRIDTNYILSIYASGIILHFGTSYMNYKNHKLLCLWSHLMLYSQNVANCIKWDHPTPSTESCYFGIFLGYITSSPIKYYSHYVQIYIYHIILCLKWIRYSVDGVSDQLSRV